MAYCTKCGAPLDANSTFCSSCGSTVENATLTSQTAVSSAPQSAAPPSYQPPPTYESSTISATPMNRPLGITILAILAVLGGLVSLAVGAFASGFGLVLVIIGLVELAVAYGYWTGKSWGWWLGIVGAVLDIVSIFSLNYFGFIIGIIMLYYLTRPNVKAWFHRK